MSNANAVDFWRNCGTEGNFLISGGSEGQRADMLVRMLENYRSRSTDAVILLTGSNMTVEAVIQAAKDKRLGNVVVSSRQYPNYHALYQMDSFHISQLLLAVARQKNYGDMDKLENYINAFIAVTKRYYTPSLAALQQLDQQFQDNQKLLKLAESSQVGEAHLRAISSFPAGTDNLRNLLRVLSSTYQCISTPDCNRKINMLTAVPKQMLICINVNSLHPRIMDLALAAELEQLMASQQRFMLILNDVSLCDAEGLFRQVDDAKNVCSRTHVGICTQNAFSWANSVPRASKPEEALLKNTQNMVLFHNPNDSDGDLDEVLKYLGTYLKHEVTVGGGHGPTLIPLLHAGNWQVTPVGMCNRVDPEDMNGFGVLLKGHRGRQIDLYRGMVV